MVFRVFITGIIFQLVTSVVFAQENRQLGYMPWHKQDSLRLDFLAIHKTNDSSKTCDLHILIKISGEAFTKKHKKLAKSFLNWCVKNYMLGDSWIDTTYGITSQIQFMQVRFNLAELHARKLRKALYENGHATNKFVRTVQKGLFMECEKDFAKLEFETSKGRNKVELEKWNRYILANLTSLAEYESSERATPTKGV